MSTPIANIEITEDPEYGVVLKYRNLEDANLFEDFLSEECYVFFQIKFELNEVSFFFGQASTVLKVQDLVDRFMLSNQ